MRTHPTNIVSAIRALIAVFEPLCDDKETLRALDALAAKREYWRDGHQLFQRIRKKTLIATEQKDDRKTAQYAFEEICAKTFYNLSDGPAPFDPDSAFWVLPLATQLGAHFGMKCPSQVSPLLKM
jgi:hypothetical protein